MAQKLALIIGNSNYEDSALSHLAMPEADVAGLADVLTDPRIGGFDGVKSIVNGASAVVRFEIESFFEDKKPDDLLLLYFTGHGIRDDQGQLYLAVNDTRHNRLRSTAIDAAFITSLMDRSRSRRQVLILDCCHSGSFTQGSKAMTGESVGIKSAFEGTGYGRIVLTATDATQYAWEDDQVIGHAQNSVFTLYLLQGLRTGEADTDADGRITLDELYEYVYDKVVGVTPKQTPGKWSYKQQGEIVIAGTPHSVPALSGRSADAGASLVPPLTSVELPAPAQATHEAPAAPAQTQAAAVRQTLDWAQGKWLIVGGLISSALIVCACAILTPLGVQIFSALDRRATVPARATPSTSIALTTPTAIAEIPAPVPTVTRQPSPSATRQPSATPTQVPSPSPTALPFTELRLVAVFSENGEFFNKVAFSPDGSTLASSSGDQTVKLWRVSDGIILRTFNLSGSGRIFDIAFSPAGAILASASEDGIARLWRVSDGTILRQMNADTHVRGLAFAPNGLLLAGGLGDRSVKFWRVSDGAVLRTLLGLTDIANNLAFSPDGSILASDGLADSVRLWRVSDGTPLRDLKTDASSAYYVAFSPDGAILASAAADDTLKLWRVADGTLLRSLHTGPGLSSFAFSPERSLVAAGSTEGELQLWRMTDGSLLLRQKTGFSVYSVAFSPDGMLLATSGSEGNLKLWDVDGVR